MIGSALERGSLIVVYDEKKISLFSKVKGSGPQDGPSALTGTDPLSLMKADPSDARFVGE
jgi:hypothetical protein